MSRRTKKSKPPRGPCAKADRDGAGCLGGRRRACLVAGASGPGGAGSELLHYLNLNRDQPLGLMQWGGFLGDRGDRAGALASFRQAVQWDSGSPALRQNYAVGLSEAGQVGEAARQLAEAVRLAPRDAGVRYTYALALNEVNRPNEARAGMEETVRLDPQFARAWYNLGLARNAATQKRKACNRNGQRNEENAALQTRSSHRSSAGVSWLGDLNRLIHRNSSFTWSLICHCRSERGVEAPG